MAFIYRWCHQWAAYSGWGFELAALAWRTQLSLLHVASLRQHCDGLTSGWLRKGELIIARQSRGARLNIYMVVLVSLGLGGLGDRRDSGGRDGGQRTCSMCLCMHPDGWQSDINGEITMFSLNERLTLKARVERANRQLRSEQNNNVLKERSKEEPEMWLDRTSVGSRSSASFHVAPSPALRCGRCLSVKQ